MIYRIDVRTNEKIDPQGESIRRQIAQQLGLELGPILTSRIFLIDSDASAAGLGAVMTQLLADPLVESAELFHGRGNSNGEGASGQKSRRIEVHLKPGVMDPVAASTEMAIRDMGLAVKQVRTGRAVIFDAPLEMATLAQIAQRVLANGVIESVHFEPYLPERFETGRAGAFELRRLPILQASETELARLSRQGHLFLSPAEMKAIQSYFRGQNREPTDVELETIAQTWSEHCVHKTLKSAVELEVRDERGRTLETRSYGNLIKETIFGSTMLLIGAAPDSDFCLSVFKDNAGVVAFDEFDAVCFKVETHNHPSAIEPYGGSATGVGGVIRDVLGTGLAAKPIANTDVFCVASPDYSQKLPRGLIHPRRILQQVVAGVRDYGNRMGIPTVNGAVYFDDRYLGNPLVFCGCVGLIPRDKIEKAAAPGDAIVLLGGRTGRDGIHGATFSSAELTDTHADEFSHAVQIGNAITEKKMADVILEARDRGLFSAVTDCGAGGLSSAVGEMGEKTGATVQLDAVPLKYDGLRYDEIWISEAQERMVLACAPGNVQQLLDLARSEDVEASVIGTFGGGDLCLQFHGQEVGRLSMRFLHDGLPMPTRKAVVVKTATAPRQTSESRAASAGPLRDRLLETLAQPNIASKHWIIRQYDHEVQGGSVIKPLTGPLQQGPSDAAVLRPKLSSRRGIAVGCGMVPHIEDPYEMSLASIDEAIRNVVAVGADPDRIAILDNFCWPSVEDELTMGTLVRACEACRDVALAYRIPFISGKDSLHNQFTNQETGQVLRIRPTLLISAIGIVADVSRCVTMDLKNAGNPVVLIEPHSPALADLAQTHRAVAALIGGGAAAACHDVSDGGLAVALAEMCIGSGRGIAIADPAFLGDDPFSQSSGRYVVELGGGTSADAARQALKQAARLRELGKVQSAAELAIGNQKIGVAEMTLAWRGTLDW